VIFRASLLLISVVSVWAQAPAPPQPIPFSHKQHAGTLKLKCNMCHRNRDPGETMGIPAASVCLQCHSAIKTDSPAIQKVAEAAKNAKPIRWRRVYEIPSFVFFSHRTHLSAGNTCEDCHGAVAQRETLSRETDISMKGCMTCHTIKKASNDCTTCHDQRN
jgi:hypothetical protein